VMSILASFSEIEHVQLLQSTPGPLGCQALF
jgi:hypothetical protein